MEMKTETLHIDYSVGEKVEELGSSHTIGGNVKYNDHLEKRVQQFQDKSNIYIYLPLDKLTFLINRLYI